MGFERRLYGHRGTAALPENTLPAFARALADGATALETDVHVTRDGHVIVSHDPDGHRLAGVDKTIASSTLDEIRGWRIDGTPLPSLSEVLTEFSGVRINIDIKPNDPRAVAPVVDLIRRHDAEERVTLASFQGSVVRALLASGFRGEISLAPWEVVRTRLGLGNPTRTTGRAVQIPTSGYGLRLDKKTFIDRCHTLGMRVDYWVVDDSKEAQRLLSLGADGIVTNRPDLIAPVMSVTP